MAPYFSDMLGACAAKAHLNLLDKVSADLPQVEGLRLHVLAVAPPVHVRDGSRAVRLVLQALHRQQRWYVVLHTGHRTIRNGCTCRSISESLLPGWQ